MTRNLKLNFSYIFASQKATLLQNVVQIGQLFHLSPVWPHLTPILHPLAPLGRSKWPKIQNLLILTSFDSSLWAGGIFPSFFLLFLKEGFYFLKICFSFFFYMFNLLFLENLHFSYVFPSFLYKLFKMLLMQVYKLSTSRYYGIKNCNYGQHLKVCN